MARIDPVDADQASPDARAVMDGARRLLGRVPTTFAMMSHSPKVARWMLAYFAAIHRDGAGSIVEGRFKNLATLKTASVNKSEYSLGHNRAYGQEFGMDADTFAALESGYETSDRFDDQEKAVIAWAEAITLNTAGDEDGRFEEMQKYFSDPEIVELTMTICHFNGMNRFTTALKLDLEQRDEVERIRTTRDLAVTEIEDFVQTTIAAR
jgi:alkylhydroperoxidase family enzyme